MQKIMIKVMNVTIMSMLLVFISTGSLASEQYSIKKEGNSLIVHSEMEGKNRVGIQVGEEFNSYGMKLGKNEIPLQFGKDEYKVTILTNIEGNKYKLVATEKIIINELDEIERFLEASEVVDWRDSELSIKKAFELTEGIETDLEKIEIVYNYISWNIEYDYEKANKDNDSYLPVIDAILAEGKGICYDYSALFAGMLRSLNIPTKLIKGFNKNIENYHAWNEVLLKEEWVIIDTTYDKSYHDSKTSVNMIKEREDYETIYEF